MPAKTVAQYLSALPTDRRAALSAVRDTINANLPDGYVEGIVYNMPGWYVPLSRYPDTYNGQPIGIAAIASQKHYMSLYLTTVYGNPVIESWFKKAYAKSGKKLDMGKSCVRFKTLDALPLDVIGEVIAEVSVDDLIATYEAVKAPTKKGAKPKPKSTRAVRVAGQKKERAAKAKSKKPKRK